MKEKTVYIAGPVTNDPDYKWKFARAQSVKRRIASGDSGTLISAMFPTGRRVWIGDGTFFAA